jgi:hydrogenase-4 component H
MKLPSLLQFRILKEALKALFTGPYTTKFPYEPHIPKEKFRGKPEFDEEECVGCGACSEVCPVQCIEVVDDQRRKLTLRYDDCIFCGQCQANCITEKGIRLTLEYDLATFDRKDAKTSIEKDILYCEYCNEVVGTIDHLRWLRRRLGPLAYADLGLLLAPSKKPKEASRKAPRLKELPKRSSRIKFLCPKCKREIVLAD